uniref:C2H2-type domain-containing protein n=1 Tax=Meloidogyne floridensis TaxID=298350 RepID=A0A915PF44_9BILA
MNNSNEFNENFPSNKTTKNYNNANEEDEDTSDTVSIPDVSEILKAAEALRKELGTKEESELCQDKYSCYRQSNLGDRYYFCIYCKFDFARCYVDRHLKRKRHSINKKAFEDAAKGDINLNSNFVIKCKDTDGCFTKSIQFKNYVYCIYCKRSLINKSSVLNVHLQSISHLNHKAIFKGQNDPMNIPKNDISKPISNVNLVYSSSDEENRENISSKSKVLKNGQSFTRYLNLKRKYKKLQYCVYCKQHYKGSCVKDHLGRKKHKMLKRAFEGNNAENTSNISTQTVQLLQETDKECINDKNILKNKENVEEKYEKMIESTGCFKKSSLGNKYAFCVYCQIDISFLRLINLEYHMKTTKHALAKNAFEAICENDVNNTDRDNEDEFEKHNKIRKKYKNNKESETREIGLFYESDSRLFYESDSSLSLDEESNAAKIASLMSQKRKRKVHNYLNF